MKNNTSMFLVLLLTALVLISCKKDNKTEDLTASFAEKTWSGAMTYTGQDAEYYSVHFNNDNTLLWSEFSGDYTGIWKLTDRQLRMIFDVSHVEVDANVFNNDN